MNGVIDYVIDYMYQVDSIYKVPRIYLCITTSNNLYGIVDPGILLVNIKGFENISRDDDLPSHSDNVVKCY